MAILRSVFLIFHFVGLLQQFTTLSHHRLLITPSIMHSQII